MWFLACMTKREKHTINFFDVKGEDVYTNSLHRGGEGALYTASVAIEGDGTEAIAFFRDADEFVKFADGVAATLNALIKSGAVTR